MSTFGDDLSAMAAGDRVLEKFLDDMSRLGAGPVPEPSAELAAVFAGAASVTAARRRGHHRMLLNAAAVFVLVIALLVAGAATHHLPAAAQRLISRVVDTVTPFHIDPDHQGPGTVPSSPAPSRRRPSPGGSHRTRPSLPHRTTPRTPAPSSAPTSAPPSVSPSAPSAPSAPSRLPTTTRAPTPSLPANGRHGVGPASAGVPRGHPTLHVPNVPPGALRSADRSRGNADGTTNDDLNGGRHRGVGQGRRGAGRGDGDRPVSSPPVPTGGQ